MRKAGAERRRYRREKVESTRKGRRRGGAHLRGGRGGDVRGLESDGAPYPIREAAVSGCSDSMLNITESNNPKYSETTKSVTTRFTRLLDASTVLLELSQRHNFLKWHSI